ncbi:hypothetical protein MTO96_031483 [Rhipicephalus appendiculatus]
MHVNPVFLVRRDIDDSARGGPGPSERGFRGGEVFHSPRCLARRSFARAFRDALLSTRKKLCFDPVLCAAPRAAAERGLTHDPGGAVHRALRRSLLVYTFRDPAGRMNVSVSYRGQTFQSEAKPQ